MAQTLRTNFSYHSHTNNRQNHLPANAFAAIHSLNDLLIALQNSLALAKHELLQPRQQAIDFILREAALLR